MKTHPALRRASAFTLIELITVIAIIAILMGLLLPYIMEAPQAAKRRQAAVDVQNIVNACRNYKNDYGKYPPIPSAMEAAEGKNDDSIMSFGDQPEGLCKVDNNHLFNVLRAIPEGENADHVLNSRQVKYIESKKAIDPKHPREGFCDGSEFSSDLRGRFLDPWGMQYCIILETDGDELVDMSKYFNDLTGPENRVHFPAVAFSMGKDSKRGGTGYAGKLRKPNSAEAPSDLVSWQP
jgi:prepilin-type N-terminal cleavage/methylation domain-containing protein